MDDLTGEEAVLGEMTANLAGHFSGLHRATAGMTVREWPGCLAASSGLPCDTFNTVYVSGPAEPDVVAEAVGLFRAAGLPFAVWSGPGRPPAGLVEGLGLRQTEVETGMALTPARFRPAPPAGLTVERVADRDMLRRFATVVAANWSPPDPSVTRFYDLTAPAVLAESCPTRLFVGHYEGIPVATAELYLGTTAGGVYSVATLASHRGRGIGAAMTTAAVEHAFHAGRRLVTLQASADGRGVYARLGFREFGEFTVYG